MAKTLNIWTGGKSPRKDFNTAEKIERYIALDQLGSFNPSLIRFNRSGTYDAYVQTGDVTFSASRGVIDGIGQIIKFTADGVNNITFGAGFDSTALYNVTSGSPLTAGDYWFYMLGVNGSIHVNVKAAT
jgi:hypothetical protein